MRRGQWSEDVQGIENHRKSLFWLKFFASPLNSTQISILCEETTGTIEDDCRYLQACVYPILIHSHSQREDHESFLELEFQGEIAMMGTPQRNNHLEGFFTTIGNKSFSVTLW